MNRNEYWKKYVEIKGDGLDCGMCKSRYNLGWDAALEYGSENSTDNKASLKLPELGEVLTKLESWSDEGVIPERRHGIIDCYDYCKQFLSLVE